MENFGSMAHVAKATPKSHKTDPDVEAAATTVEASGEDDISEQLRTFEDTARASAAAAVVQVEGNVEATSEAPGPVPVSTLTDEEIRDLASRRKRMRSLGHLLTHSPAISDCPGCMARSKAKKHFRKSFEKDDVKHHDEVTLDQVTMTDFNGTLGIGNFRYGIVLWHVPKEFGQFVSLRGLDLRETDRFFNEFARIFNDGDYIAKMVVYCDAHRTLVSLCDLHGLPRKHPPPGATNKCPVIERKINHMLAGIRAYLASGSLPMCFWPFAGECFSFNDNLKLRFKEDGTSYVPYTNVIGHAFTGSQFVTGQLVFYKPAPTIMKLPKVGDRLRPGLFMKYYVSGGRWNNQYIVADIEGFANKNLHNAT